MTTAEQVSELFDNDGQCFESDPAADGEPVSLAAACERAGGRRERRDGDGERYTFPDGSAITIHGDAWDLGFVGCWCWQGAGHDARCGR